MSVGNITITADVGPKLSVSALVITNVRSLHYDFPSDRLQITLADGTVQHYDYSTIATITHTISSGVATVTIST